jgi:hypothetical protein
VESRNRGEVSGFVGIKLLPRPTNLPLESLSLRISCFELMMVFFFFLTSICTSPAMTPKCLANLMSLNCQS